jgi:hypothetical protein
VSWEQVTRYALRCDGRVTVDRQCPNLYEVQRCDGECEGGCGQGCSTPALWEDQERSEMPDHLRYTPWMVLPDGRLFCPQHVAGQLAFARAQIEGLPFPAPGDTAPPC